jgi:hypothetical protein
LFKSILSTENHKYKWGYLSWQWSLFSFEALLDHWNNADMSLSTVEIDDLWRLNDTWDEKLYHFHIQCEFQSEHCLCSE